MKVIVFQTLLDLGLITDKIFPTGKPDESILIISTCMKSVKSWCRKKWLRICVVRRKFKLELCP